MRIDEKVKEIIEGIGGLSFEFNDWSRSNYTLSKTVLPACLYILPVSGTLLNKNGRLRDRPNAMIAFLDLAELDFDGTTNEPTVERMKGFAKRFIAAVNRSGWFRQVPENIPYSVVYDKLSDNVTGVVLNLELEELTGDCIANL
ncbi:MAG: hypothetical protein LBV41_12880 [Cytophagaceae bacterium]|jgi:hypothetical protein|nr:hypothetical protein [Cytophagaceae bacterium]